MLTEEQLSFEHRIGIHKVAAGMPGFSLRVTKASRSYVLRTMFQGKRREFGLGGFPAVSTLNALSAALAIRCLLSDGWDPVVLAEEAKQALRSWDYPAMRPTTRDGAYSLEQLAAGWERHATGAIRLHDTRLFYALGRYPLRKISAGTLRSVLADSRDRALVGKLRAMWEFVERSVDLPPAKEYFAEVERT